MDHQGRQAILLTNLKVIDVFAGKFADLHLKEIGLTRSQSHVIFFLANEGGKDVHQKDIERALILTNLTVSGLLNRLEDKGFINRISDPKDSRARRILLTEKAKQTVESIHQSMIRTEHMLLEGLSEQEATLLSKLLRKVAENAISNS